MVPNVLPVIATLGAMGLWGIPLDVGTIMVGAIVLGIAVDDTIHFITHYRTARGAGSSPRDAIAITMQRAGRAIVTTSCALALGFFALTLSSWQSIASFGLLSGIAILAALAADLFVLPALILVLSPAASGPERRQVSRTAPRRGRGLLAVLAILATGGMLHAAAAGIASPSDARPVCRWLASGHVLPPGSLDSSCPLAPFERVELFEVAGKSFRPQEEEKLRSALAVGFALRARVAGSDQSRWIEVPLLGEQRGPRPLPRLAAAGLGSLVLVGLAIFLLAYSSAPAALPFLVLCSALAVLAIDALCGSLAQLPAWPALIALGLAPASAAHLALSFPRPGGLIATAPGVVVFLYSAATPVLAILLWGAHEYPALVRAASAACASLTALVWVLLVLKCRMQQRESPVALERVRARAALSGTVLVGGALALLWLATEVGSIGSALDLLAAGVVMLPLPIGYALARYQLNDVRPHVRQLASYALLHVAWAVAIATLLAEILHRRPPRLLVDPLTALGSLTLVLLLAGGARDALWRSVRRGIPTLGARLRELERRHALELEPLREPDETVALSAEAMHAGLAGPRVSFFLRADAGWRLAASFGSDVAVAPELAESAAGICGELGVSIHLAYEGGAEGPRADRLREACVELVTPVRCQGELVGIVLIGASGDGLPYTRPEQSFADAIAARAGVAVQRARLADELLRAERFETVGRISAGLAHDLGKPLSLVYQRARAMGRSALPPEEVRRHAESIAALADDALATLDHLVEQGRAERRPGSSAPLSDLIARAAQAAERLHGTDRIAVRLTPSLPEVSAPRDLQAALANLLDNALRASPCSPVEVYAIADGDDVVVEIIDHGEGMDRDTLRRAFQPFFTTRSRQGGRGIGLAASLALVEQLGGTLELDSRPGCGTLARIRVPAAPRKDGRVP
jgi:signal transduction histidine kinase